MSDSSQEPGKARRAQVMGADFVERAMSSADAFSRPLQEWLNEHAWGTTWLRDGLDLKTRSLCTCAMLASLGRSTELRGHIRGAINNGATATEIREVCFTAQYMPVHRRLLRRSETPAKCCRNLV